MSKTIERMEHDIASLEARLKDGRERIAEAQEQGVDTEAWEEFWTKLLEDYHAMCERLRRESEGTA